MPIYTCPVCKGEVKNSVKGYLSHRKPGGECDQRIAEKKRQKKENNVSRDGKHRLE